MTATLTTGLLAFLSLLLALAFDRAGVLWVAMALGLLLYLLCRPTTYRVYRGDE